MDPFIAQASKPVGVRIVLFDGVDDLLVLKPRDNDRWYIPGGWLLPNESPKHACSRLIKQQTGLDVPSARFLCVDYKHQSDNQPESLQFLFYGGVVGGEAIDQIKLDTAEFEEFRFESTETALHMLTVSGADRVRMSLNVLARDEGYYLENGMLVH